VTRVVLGMTLYNNATCLPEAMESLQAQTMTNFAMVLVDDGSTDNTQALAHDYAAADARLTYVRHAERQGMVPTWRHAFEMATAAHPTAEYFAWVSDHDRWAPTWLETLVDDLDRHPDAVLSYPLVTRIDQEGHELDKAPRSFDTGDVPLPRARWTRFCWEGFGSGDMVYGLMRIDAARRAGVFRPVLNPDRLLIAELVLQGQIRQVEAPLWFRRQAGEASVARQRTTLFAGTPPPRFGWPPSLQHAALLAAALSAPGARAPMAAPTRWAMLVEYIVASGWRAYRKTDTSKRFGRGVDQAHFVKKVAKKTVRVSVYYTLVSMHAVVGRARRMSRRALYEVLMWTHRVGLRSPRGGSHPR
jgi:hypothetical protein